MNYAKIFSKIQFLNILTHSQHRKIPQFPLHHQITTTIKKSKLSRHPEKAWIITYLLQYNYIDFTISISDTGIGIEKDKLNKLFDEKKKMDKNTKNTIQIDYVCIFGGVDVL